MTDREFEPGDTVEVKSGGPTMTYVGDDRKTGLAKCEWFYSGEKKAEMFHHVGLKKATLRTSQTRALRG